jgi:hypothetical protein
VLGQDEPIDSVTALAAGRDPLEVALNRRAGIIRPVARVRVQVKKELFLWVVDCYLTPSDDQFLSTVILFGRH